MKIYEDPNKKCSNSDLTAVLQWGLVIVFRQQCSGYLVVVIFFFVVSGKVELMSDLRKETYKWPWPATSATPSFWWIRELFEIPARGVDPLKYAGGSIVEEAVIFLREAEMQKRSSAGPQSGLLANRSFRSSALSHEALWYVFAWNVLRTCKPF